MEPRRLCLVLGLLLALLFTLRHGARASVLTGLLIALLQIGFVLLAPVTGGLSLIPAAAIGVGVARGKLPHRDGSCRRRFLSECSGNKQEDGSLAGDLSGIASKELLELLRPYTFPPFDSAPPSSPATSPASTMPPTTGTATTTLKMASVDAWTTTVGQLAAATSAPRFSSRRAASSEAASSGDHSASRS